MPKISGRLIAAVLSTAIEEFGIAALMLWGLSYFGITVPLPVFVTVLVVWGMLATFIYWKGTGTLHQKPLIGLSSMVGSTGKAATLLNPEGQVKIGSETWNANSNKGNIEPGEAITVTGQDRLLLIVTKIEHK